LNDIFKIATTSRKVVEMQINTHNYNTIMHITNSFYGKDILMNKMLMKYYTVD